MPKYVLFLKEGNITYALTKLLINPNEAIAEASNKKEAEKKLTKKFKLITLKLQ